MTCQDKTPKNGWPIPDAPHPNWHQELINTLMHIDQSVGGSVDTEQINDLGYNMEYRSAPGDKGGPAFYEHPTNPWRSSFVFDTFGYYKDAQINLLAQGPGLETVSAPNYMKFEAKIWTKQWAIRRGSWRGTASERENTFRLYDDTTNTLLNTWTFAAGNEPGRAFNVDDFAIEPGIVYRLEADRSHTSESYVFRPNESESYDENSYGKITESYFPGSSYGVGWYSWSTLRITPFVDEGTWVLLFGDMEQSDFDRHENPYISSYLSVGWSTSLPESVTLEVDVINVHNLIDADGNLTQFADPVNYDVLKTNVSPGVDLTDIDPATNRAVALRFRWTREVDTFELGWLTSIARQYETSMIPQYI